MRVLVTGANGFMGKNLTARLSSLVDVEILTFTRDHQPAELPPLVAQADFIFHVAGVNRPKNISEFEAGNSDLTRMLCSAVAMTGRPIPILYASSSQAELDNPYGISKRNAEKALQDLASAHGVPVYIFRLPNVFGQGARPNYNSVVATFCHNIARNLPIRINDPSSVVVLVYINDVVQKFVEIMRNPPKTVKGGGLTVEPQYRITVGELAAQLQAFKDTCIPFRAGDTETAFTMALHETYLSYQP